MTKKDYIRAANLVKTRLTNQKKNSKLLDMSFLEDAFVELFQSDNPRFDERRFRQACKE